MKLVFLVMFFSFFASVAFSQANEQKEVLPDSTKKIQVVETACGKCQLGLPGKGCDLAVRLNGKAFYVDGADIDSYGDAHAKDGFCNAIRKANVQGELINNRFKVTYFKLIPDPVIKDVKIKNDR